MSKNPIHTALTIIFGGLLVVTIAFALFQIGDINDLTERNETLQTQIDGLKTENATLTEANAVMGVENQRLVTENEELKQVVSSLETKVNANVDLGFDMNEFLDGVDMDALLNP